MNPDLLIILAAVIYLGAIAANRFLGERNYHSLSKEDRLKFTDAFSGHRSLATYLPLGTLLMILAGTMLAPSLAIFIVLVGFAIFAIVSVTIQVAVYRRLRELGLPTAYEKQFLVQCIVVQVGQLIALSLVMAHLILRIS